MASKFKNNDRSIKSLELAFVCVGPGLFYDNSFNHKESGLGKRSRPVGSHSIPYLSFCSGSTPEKGGRRKLEMK